MAEVKLHDGSTLEFEVYGEGSTTLLLLTNPHTVEGPQAEELRKYGADPALGKNLIDGLKDIVRVVAFDYEGNTLRLPKAQTLTPDNIVADFLTVADAAGADTFAYYGYSWLAMVGLQLAVRTKRLVALAMGGFPPLDGPYKEMLQVTSAANNIARNPTAEKDEWGGLSIDQTQQYVTLYQALQGFDDRAIQAQITYPRLCFVGSADEILYGENWGNLLMNLAQPIMRNRAELESLGWEVHILDGLDHMQAMQASLVVPLLRSWLTRA
jgi:pimeloyl-ACP methyl ester carboxylesterase